MDESVSDYPNRGATSHDGSMPRRIAAVVVGVLLVAGSVACRGGTDPKQQPAAAGASPVRPARTATSPDRPRPLTYAEGQVIHYGRRSIDTGQDLLSLDLTDDGVAFTTFDGLLWFTDGRTITQIGLTTRGQATDGGVAWGPGGRPNQQIVSANAGSRLAWLEFARLDDGVDRPEVVVYDTHEMRRVARFQIDLRRGCQPCAQIVSLDADGVYWTDTLQRGFGVNDPSRGPGRLFRYDVSTGKQTRVSVQDYQAELRRTPRMLVVGDDPDAGIVEDGINQDFAFIGRLLVANGSGSGDPTFDPVSGRELRLRASARFGYGFGAAERLYLFQWLDDDRFALLDGTSWNSGHYAGEDLLVCRISRHRCQVAVRRPLSSGSPIVPGIGTPGGEAAQDRAASFSGR
ncbi:MAG: hypothetical protein JWR90_860 [Marmoricola sp.]|nr:hypothetical protein [Marmoricola sp.]